MFGRAARITMAILANVQPWERRNGLFVPVSLFIRARRFLLPLRDQIHRKVVYSPFQFEERSQLFIGARNETLFVAAMRVRNPDRAALRIQG